MVIQHYTYYVLYNNKFTSGCESCATACLSPEVVHHVFISCSDPGGGVQCFEIFKQSLRSLVALIENREVLYCGSG